MSKVKGHIRQNNFIIVIKFVIHYRLAASKCCYGGARFNKSMYSYCSFHVWQKILICEVKVPQIIILNSTRVLKTVRNCRSLWFFLSDFIYSCDFGRFQWSHKVFINLLHFTFFPCLFSKNEKFGCVFSPLETSRDFNHEKQTSAYFSCTVCDVWRFQLRAAAFVCLLFVPLWTIRSSSWMQIIQHPLINTFPTRVKVIIL